MGLAGWGEAAGPGETSATAEGRSLCGLIINAVIAASSTHTNKTKTNLGLMGFDDKQKIRDRQEPVPDWNFTGPN
jgi:hypothetical protein